MKRACLLIAVPALLVALGFAQTPTPSSTTDSTSIKGCLGGSASNYTLVEDNTGHNFKITTSSVDLKPHLGHDVALVGQKATTGAADGSFAVTSLNMISEHCAAAAAAPAGSVSTPVDTVTPPPAAAAIPAATIPATPDTTSAPATPSAVSAATAVTPTEPAVTTTVAAPAATGLPAAETASAPAATATVAPSATSPAGPVVTPNVVVPAAAPTAPTVADSASAPAAATVAPDATARTDAVVVPKVATAHHTRMPADTKRATPPAAAAAPPAETATPVADAAKPPAADSAPSQAAATPDAAAPTPAVPVKKGSSPWLWISIAVVVLILGTLVPLINRWRKRRLLAESDKQNLSFSHRASSESGNSAKPETRKVA